MVSFLFHEGEALIQTTSAEFDLLPNKIASGVQIRAGRALLGWTQRDLARAAGLHPKAVAYWEAKKAFGDRREEVGVGRIREALARSGVVAFKDPTPGVRFVAQR